MADRNRPVFRPTYRPVTSGSSELDPDIIPPKKSNTGLTIALIVGGLILLIIIGVLVWYFFFRSTPTQQDVVATLGEDCSTKPCVNPLVCENNVCKGTNNGPCQNNTNCTQGLVCDQGACRVPLFGRCTLNTDCASGLICVNSTCVLPP